MVGPPIRPDLRNQPRNLLDTRWWLVGVGLALASVVALWGVLLRHRRPFSHRAAVYSLALLDIGLLPVLWWLHTLVSRQHAHRVAESPSFACTPGDIWTRAAESEAESVFAFNDVAERLERVRAIRHLIERSQQAARQEIRHDRLCRQVARTLGAHPALRTTRDGSTRRSRGGRRGDVVRLAVESFVDGVLGEGFAAARLDAGAATSTGSRAAALRRMGLEERGHAELGSDIVRWCLGEHPRGCIDLKRRVKTIDFAG